MEILDLNEEEDSCQTVSHRVVLVYLRPTQDHFFRIIPTLQFHCYINLER